MKRVQKLTLAALFFAIGMVLPFLTGNIQVIGQMLCPMHLPVLLCGLILGWKYGLAVGFLLPLTRSVAFGMPLLFPTAVSMAFELATYGFVSGLLYSRSKWQCTRAVYRCLIIAMLAGRVVMGVANMILYGVTGSVYTWSMYISGALLDAIPGIIVQLILIPVIMVALNQAHLVPFKHEEPAAEQHA